MLSVERWVQPRDLRESVDLPVQEPMRANRSGKTPSTDQKRQLRRKTATETQADAWRLNPGDQVRGPNGQLITIKDVKPHKTDSSKCVITLDGGGAMIEDRGAEFTIVRGNHRQMSLPDTPGLPGGNFNYLPGGAAVEGVDPGSLTGSQTCPNCGGHMRLNRGQLTCTRCNFQTYPGAAGGGSGGGSYAMDPEQAQLSNPSGRSNNSLVHGSRHIAGDAEHRQLHEGQPPGPEGYVHDFNRPWLDPDAGDVAHLVRQPWPSDLEQHMQRDHAGSSLWHRHRDQGPYEQHGVYEAALRRQAAKYAPPVASAIARRAQAVLDLPEGAQQ